jgi:PKD repeat protein/N-acetyl-anhydromuramyl-L-alanine amidase AmpD
MKKIILIFFAFSTLTGFSQFKIEDLLNTKITTTKTKDGVFVQRDLTQYIGFVASQTDSTVQGNSEELLWLKYFNSPHPNVATLEKYFKNASKEFGVPAELLMAIGQVENNWTQVGPSIDQGWGIMHLVDNNYCSTLNEAAAILKLDPQILKDNAKQNIRGAAALIKKYAGTKKHKKLEDWFDAIKKFSGLINDDLNEQQAERYYQVLTDGVEAKTVWDETVKINSHPNINIANKITYKSRQTNSSDYSPAISDLISYNYSSRNGQDIDTWVHHYIGTGTYAGAISWFHNSAAQASAHFVIRSSDGQITQCVAVADKAWHCGASGYPLNNSRSIGVEHEATSANPSLWNSSAMLHASATMVCYFADLYSIPATFHSCPGILGHQEMPGTSTDCPGAMPWSTWISYFNACNGTTTPTAPTGLSSAQTTCPTDNVAFSWTNSGTGWHIDVSTSSSFTTYYWKYVSGLTTFTGPTGFVDHTDGTTPLVFQQGTTYYWRISTGSTTVSGPSFVMHTCTALPASLTATVASCPASSVNFSWSNSGSGWHIDVSTSSSFSTYWWKYVSGLTTYTGPTGFVDHTDGVTPWTLQDGVTYYWRITGGSVVNGSSFTKQACDVTAPTTVIPAISTWQSQDFDVSFTDADNAGGSGVSKKYFQVMDYNGTEWRANGQNGYFNDNFNTAINTEWQTTSGAGTWVVTSGQLEQTDQTLNNTILSAAVNQTATNDYMYQWTGKISGTGTSKRSGLHFFASEATSAERGDSYLAWFDVDQGNCKIYKSTANVLSLINTYTYTLTAGTAYDYKVTYSPSTGKILIWINDTQVASWTDPSPITSGSYISLRAGNCDGFFDNVKVRKGRGNSATVSVGNFTNKDVRYESPDSTLEACRINTIINDINGNWSSQAVQNIKIDWSGPLTTPSITGTWKTTDFTATFSDVDALSGVQEKYYNVNQYNGTDWVANGANGFIHDDFENTVGSNWQTVANGGTWTIVNHQLSQTDEAATNSNLYTALTQSAAYTYLYHWTGTATGSSTTLKRFGLHFFADDATLTNRGNSYLAFFRFDQNRIEIQKGTSNTLVYADTIPNDLTPGMVYDYKVSYCPASGLINVYLNNLLMLSWTDPSPITSGSYISLRSGNCNITIDNLEVYRSRGASQMVTVGTGTTKDVQFDNPSPTQPSCMIKSMAIDKLHNISAAGSLNVNIDRTAPNTFTVNDGTGSDIDTTTSTTTLSANWTASSDANSGIAKYWYAIGTTAGATNVVAWTNNSLNTTVTKTGLSLTPGQMYYVSVKAENGAGLQTVVNSDGIYIASSTTANFSMTPNPVCAGVAVTFTNTSMNATSYAWTFAGGTPASSTAASPTVVFNASGSHTVQLIATGASGSNTTSQQITVSPLAVADFSANTTNVTLPSGMVLFTNNSANASSFLWNFGDGNTSTGQAPWNNYTVAGDYTVTLIAQNTQCGNDTLVITNYIHVEQAVGINEFTTNSGLTIFPNPSTSSAEIAYYTEASEMVELYAIDELGRKINLYYGKCIEGKNIFILNRDVIPLTVGIYEIVLEINNVKRLTKMIVY